MLEFPFKDQKPTLTLIGGDATCCFAKRTSHDYEKSSPLQKKFLRQSQSTTTEPEPKKKQKLSIWSKRVEIVLTDEMS